MYLCVLKYMRTCTYVYKVRLYIILHKDEMSLYLYLKYKEKNGRIEVYKMGDMKKKSIVHIPT